MGASTDCASQPATKRVTSALRSSPCSAHNKERLMLGGTGLLESCRRVAHPLACGARRPIQTRLLPAPKMTRGPPLMSSRGASIMSSRGAKRRRIPCLARVIPSRPLSSRAAPLSSRAEGEGSPWKSWRQRYPDNKDSHRDLSSGMLTVAVSHTIAGLTFA